MKRSFILCLATLLAIGAVSVFAIDDSRAISAPSPEPVCRMVSPNGEKCLLWMFPGNVVSSQRLETIRKNIYWKPADSTARSPRQIEESSKP